MVNGLKTFFLELLKTNAARVTAYVAAAAVGAVAMADAAIEAIELSPEFMVGVAGFAAVVATEVIRLLVWSQASVEALQKSDIPVTGTQKEVESAKAEE